MARADIKLPDNLAKKLSHLGSEFDGVAEKVLDAGGQAALRVVKQSLESVVGKGTKYPSRSTGELVEALGVSPAKVGRDGNHNVKIGFSEPRSDGNSNARIANVLEYGKSGQPAKPFLKPAKNETKKAALAAMEQVFNQEVKL